MQENVGSGKCCWEESSINTKRKRYGFLNPKRDYSVKTYLLRTYYLIIFFSCVKSVECQTINADRIGFSVSHFINKPNYGTSFFRPFILTIIWWQPNLRVKGRGGNRHFFVITWNIASSFWLFKLKILSFLWRFRLY